MECTLSHTFSVPNPFTHSIKDNFPHTNVFICEMAFKKGVDGGRRSVMGQIHIWREPCPFLTAYTPAVEAGLVILQSLPPAIPAAQAGQCHTVLRGKAMDWELWWGRCGWVCPISGRSPRCHWVPDFQPGTFVSAGRILLRKYRTVAWRQTENTEASKKPLCTFALDSP